MSLITNNISGSSSNNWQIGVTGSVVISDRPTEATFPRLPSDVSLFIDGTKRTVLKGDSTFSGSIVASGSTILAGGVTLAGNSQTVTHTGTGDLTISSNNGNVLVEGTIFNGNDVGVTGDLSVNGGDVFTSAPTFNLINTSATPIRIGAASPGVEIGSTSGWVSTKGVHTVSGSLIVTGSSIVAGDITAAGDIAVNGGDVFTSAATFNLIESNAANINIGGNSQTVNVGNSTAGTGQTVVRNMLSVSGTNGISTIGNVTLNSTSARSITHVGASGQNLTITSTSGDVLVEGTTFSGNDVTVAGDITVSGGDIISTASPFNLLSSPVKINVGASSTGIDLGGSTSWVSTKGTHTVSGSLVVTGSSILLGNVTLTGASQTITHSGTGNLTISSGNDTLIEGSTFSGNNVTVPGTINANGGSIATNQTTFALANTTATTVNIGGGATSGVNIGNASGDITLAGPLKLSNNTLKSSTGTPITLSGTDVTVAGNIAANGGSITTTAATFNLANASASTVNIGGAATTGVSIGNASGDVTLAGPLKLSSNTIKSSTSTPITLSGNDVTVAGDVAVNGGDLTTSAATFNLLNATATTLNVGSAATTINAGAPGVTLNVGNVLTGTTSQVTVKGNLQIDGNNIKSKGGTYTPITLSDTSRNTYLNGIVYVGDALSGGGDIIFRPQLTPSVLSTDLQTTSTTVNLFAADPAGGMGTTTVNIGRTGSTNRVNVGGYLKVIGNVILNSNGDNSLTLDSLTSGVTVGGQLTVGDLTTSGGGDIYQKPPSAQASDIISTATTANIYADAGNTTTINLGTSTATTINIGKSTGTGTITGYGLQLRPNQSGLRVKASAQQLNLALGADASALGTKIAFNSASFDTSGDFNTTTYQFTAPVAGRYFISTSVKLVAVDSAANYYILNLVRNSSIFIRLEIIDPGGFYNGAAYDLAYMTMSGNAVVNLALGDVLYVAVNQVGGTAQTDTSVSGDGTYLSCYLLG